MTILDNILRDKRREVLLRKAVIPVSQLESSALFTRPTFSLAKQLRENKYGIIAEHKRKSPSKDSINSSFTVEEVVSGYENAGVAGISVLTDSKYFGGSLEDLIIARSSVKIPLLRKDFIVEEYQILEAKANGADVILLIAAALSSVEIAKFSTLAKSLSLDVLLEVHNESELQRSLMPNIDMIGVNNRNLATFEVSLNTSIDLAEKIPTDFVKISESGISSVENIVELANFGYKGFLIGERFMKSNNAGEAAKQFIQQLEQLKDS